jgi:hypothetical protein
MRFIFSPEITNVKFLRQLGAPFGMVFEPGASGPPRFINVLKFSTRRFFSNGSTSFVFSFLFGVILSDFVNGTFSSIDFVFVFVLDGLGPASKINSTSSS